jgi:hypothetical protein
MGNRAAVALGIALVFAAEAIFWDLALAENDRPSSATVESPAVVTATAAPAEGFTTQSPRVIVSVTGFEPPREGGVEVVVKAQSEGSQKEQEIGRFGVFPQSAFKAPDPSKAKRFGLPLPKELAASKTLTLRVYLVPFKGSGEGALLELGGAEIR